MDWLPALRALVREFKEAPPEWGRIDCCQLANVYVKARTGVDHAPRFPYHDKAGALRLLAEHHGIINLISSCIGSPHDGEAMPGDLVVVDIGIDGEGLTTGVYNGHYVVGFHPEIGLGRIAHRPIKAAWTI